MRAFTEEDARNICSFELSNPLVFGRFCALMGIKVTTTSRSTGVDNWFICPPASPEIVLPFVEAQAWLRGYTAAWLLGRQETRGLADKVRALLKRDEEERIGP